jgi:hypothetical protein
MAIKKSVKKVGSSIVRAETKKAASAPKVAAGRKVVAAQPTSYKPVAKPNPVKQTVLSGILGETVSQPPAPAPTAPESSSKPQEISGEELYNRIQFNAYLLAEKDGFKADPVHYWIQAERAAKAEIRHPTGS